MKLCTHIEKQDIKIDCSKIPPFEANCLARETLKAVERSFAIPGTKEKYEEWLKEYKTRNKERTESGAGGL